MHQRAGGERHELATLVGEAPGGDGEPARVGEVGEPKQRRHGLVQTLDLGSDLRHHPLGHAGGPTSEDHRDVGAIACDARRRIGGQGILVADRAGDVRRRAEDAVVRIGDFKQQLQRRDAIAHPRHTLGEAGVVQEDLGVGVLEQVQQLVVEVAVVDVDRDRAHLQRGEERLAVLGAVVQVLGDLGPLVDAGRAHRAGQRATRGRRRRPRSGARRPARARAPPASRRRWTPKSSRSASPRCLHSVRRAGMMRTSGFQRSRSRPVPATWRATSGIASASFLAVSTGWTGSPSHARTSVGMRSVARSSGEGRSERPAPRRILLTVVPSALSRYSRFLSRGARKAFRQNGRDRSGAHRRNQGVQSRDHDGSGTSLVQALLRGPRRPRRRRDREHESLDTLRCLQRGIDRSCASHRRPAEHGPVDVDGVEQPEHVGSERRPGVAVGIGRRTGTAVAAGVIADETSGIRHALPPEHARLVLLGHARQQSVPPDERSARAALAHSEVDVGDPHSPFDVRTVLGHLRPWRACRASRRSRP